MSIISEVVGPGDKIQQLPKEGIVKLSQGLVAQGEYITSNVGGVLRQSKRGTFSVEGIRKRYLPTVNDLVLGTIIDRHSENFVVDIGSPFPAILPQLSFEGATRRNRPNLVVGDLVYARVVSVNKDTDPVLTCVDAAGRASGFGGLKGGLTVTCSLNQAARLLRQPPPSAVENLAVNMQFELAVGMNGKVWVKAATAAETVLVANAVQEV
mmetsp:Transcript_12051/g.21598  ORF Transcript_12051/g.21598 Transcript_12051/m.21598 type:complete len:210 (-) Transcript_12051:288-917(-)